MAARAADSLPREVWELLSSERTRQGFYEKAVTFLMREGGDHWCCRFPDVVKVFIV